MMKKIFKNLCLGVCTGSLIFVLMSLIYMFFSNSETMVISKSSYMKNVIASIVVGVGFYVPSVIYENEKIDMKLKVIFHLGIGFTIYILSAFYAGWIPVQFGAGTIFTTILIMILITLLIWSGFYFYYKNEARKINKKIREINK